MEIKKLILALGVVVILVVVVALAATMADEDALISTSKENFSYNEIGDEVTITKYIGSSPDVIIPSQIEGKPVTMIENGAFYYPHSSTIKLASIVIPDSIISIGHMTFRGNNLTSVIIPDSITKIGSFTFWENKLTSITIPDSVISIEQMAFRDNDLTSVTIPDSVTWIGQMAFRDNNLTSVTIPDSVLRMGDAAFSDNKVTLTVQKPIWGSPWGADNVIWTDDTPYPTPSSWPTPDKLSFNMKSQSEFIWHIALINLTDSHRYDETSVTALNSMLNENIPNNGFLSVYEYFDIASRGKLQVSCNITIYDSDYSTADFNDRKPNYNFENGLFEEAVKHGEMYVYNGDYHAGSLIIAMPVEDRSNMLWPHAWMGGELTLFPINMVLQTVMLHELTHIFGLYDLYFVDPDKRAVSTFDLAGYLKVGMYNSINAHHREQLGWLDSSDYNDTTVSGVEKISKSGRYALNPSTAQDGTVAYRFGEKGTESFMIEYRHADGVGIDNILPNDSEAGLLIYRVNTKYNGNDIYGNYEIFMFREGPIGERVNFLFGEGEEYGMLNGSDNYDYLDSICYSDKTNSQILVDNIKFNDGGTVSFDIDFENM